MIFMHVNIVSNSVAGCGRTGVNANFVIDFTFLDKKLFVAVNEGTRLLSAAEVKSFDLAAAQIRKFLLDGSFTVSLNSPVSKLFGISARFPGLPALAIN